MSSAPQSEKEKFLAWYKAEQAKGLLGLRITPGDIPPGTTEEDVYRALNEINDAVAAGRVEPLVGL